MKDHNRMMRVADEIRNVDVFNEIGNILLNGALGPPLKASTEDVAVYRVHSRLIGHRVVVYVDRRSFKLISVEW